MINRIVLAISVLALSACAPALPTLAVTATPTPRPMATAASPAPPATVARVVAAVVRVHGAPEGQPGYEEIRGYVMAGDSVTVGECSSNWCSISAPIAGYVYQGCLAEFADGRKCEATK